MDDTTNPKILASLKTIFATRDDLDHAIDYQKSLLARLEELDTNHRSIHEHMHKLTVAHNAVREDTNDLLRYRNDVAVALQNLVEAYHQIRNELRKSIDVASRMQQDSNRMTILENRIMQLESYTNNLLQPSHPDKLGQ